MSRGGRGIATVCGFASALLVAACAASPTHPYVSALASGDRALGAGRMHEAGQEYDRAARSAQRGVDRDEATYRAAQSYRRAGETTLALERFDWLAANGSPDGRETRGALEAARIRLSLGETARAEADFLAIARRSPASAAAVRAIQIELLEHDGRDPSGAESVAWLERISPPLSETPLAPTLHYERARRLVTLGRNDEAVRAFESLLSWTYPDNRHWDDGGLAYARFLVAQSRPRDALAVIHRVLAVRQHATIAPGSYERPHFAELKLYAARILRDELHESAAAADAFHAVYEMFTHSLLRDDALLEEATLRTELGQTARACEVFTTLAREFPCTRRGREGHERARSCGAAIRADLGADCHRTRDGSSTDSDS